MIKTRIFICINGSKAFLALLHTLIAIAFINNVVIFTFSSWTTWSIYNIFLCILYVATLYYTRVSSYNEIYYDANDQIAKDVVKYVTLIIVSIGPTLVILYVFAITFWIWLFSVDSIIHCWFIFLICDDDQKLFEHICCPCYKCIENCMFFCCKDERAMDEVELLQIQIND